MGDDQHGAGVFEQRVFQRTQGFHVQVIRRFVQQQHVAALDQRLGEVQATAFTTGQVAHLLLLVLAVEIEAARISSRSHLEFAHVDDVQAARDVFPHGLFVAQCVTRLVHEGHLHGLANDDFTAVRLFLAGDQLEQRGLTRTVGADDADDGAGRDVHVELVDQHTVAKTLADVLELDHLAAQAVGHRNEDFLGFVALLVFNVRQFLEAGQT